jgi:flagellar biosynthesis regulator FlbT
MKRSVFLKSTVGAVLASLFPVSLMAEETSLPKKKQILQSLNVRRLIVHIKRQIEQIAHKQLLFQQPNTEQVRQQFATRVSDLLQLYKDEEFIKAESTVISVKDHPTEEHSVTAKVIIYPVSVKESVIIDMYISSNTKCEPHINELK